MRYRVDMKKAMAVCALLLGAVLLVQVDPGAKYAHRRELRMNVSDTIDALRFPLYIDETGKEYGFVERPHAYFRRSDCSGQLPLTKEPSGGEFVVIPELRNGATIYLCYQ